MKNKIISVLIVLVLILNLGVVIAEEEGVYIDKYISYTDSMEPVLEDYDENGEIDIGSEDKTIYLDSYGKNFFGEMRNVKIKKEKDGHSIEFKEGGLLNRRERGLFRNIRKGGRLFFNRQNRLIKAELELAKADKLDLKDYTYELPTDGKIILKEDGKVDLELKKGGKFKYYKKEKPEKAVTYDNVKSEGKFKIDEEGEVSEAEFGVTRDSEFLFKGWKYKVPKDGEVSLKEKKVDIKMPKDEKIEYPEKQSDAEESILFSYHVGDGAELEFENGNKFELKGEGIIFYKDGEISFWGEEGVIKDKDGNADILIQNPDFKGDYEEGKEVYLVSDESEIDKEKHSIFVTDSKLIITSPTENGIAASFTEFNRFGFKISSSNSVAVQAREGRVIISPAPQGEAPNIQISGKGAVSLDERMVRAEGGEMYFDINGAKIGDFSQADFDVASKITLINDDGTNLKNFHLYSNGKEQYAALAEGDFVGPLEAYQTQQGFYISPKLAFNQLTDAAQDFFVKEIKDPGQQQQLAYMASTGDHHQLQMTLDNMIRIEEERRRNPLAASVRIPTGGGSGVIIGETPDGFPVVLSAGHLGGATRPGYVERIEMSDGRKFKAKVIAGRSDYGGSGHDYSVMVGTTRIEKVPYIPVASEHHVINVGDPSS